MYDNYFSSTGKFARKKYRTQPSVEFEFQIKKCTLFKKQFVVIFASNILILKNYLASLATLRPELVCLILKLVVF